MITSPDPEQWLVVNQTDTVTFECSATGIPTPLIQWYQGDLLLNGTGPGINSRVNLTTAVNAPLDELGTAMSTLTINDTIGGDSGNYTCVASNKWFSSDEVMRAIDLDTIELLVQGKCTFVYRTIAIQPSMHVVPPTVTPLMTNQRIRTNETESAFLIFKIENAAPPVVDTTIRWFYSSDFAFTFLLKALILRK